MLRVRRQHHRTHELNIEGGEQLFSPFLREDVHKGKSNEKFFCSLLIGLIFVGLVTRWNGQRQQRQLQEEWLDKDFVKVRPQAGQVLFAPSDFGRTLQIGGSVFSAPISLSTGSHFSRGDEHFFVKYTVEQIEKDGVSIAYEADGAEPGPISSSSGSVKLNWK